MRVKDHLKAYCMLEWRFLETIYYSKIDSRTLEWKIGAV